MSSSLQAALETFVTREKLPVSYLQTVEQWFQPLALTLLQKVSASTSTLVVGISGSQGSGKSTLASLLVLMLKELMGLRCINLSLDDFYHTHAQRQHLARTVHPLFATRGVPGTHDVALAVKTLQALKREGEVAIPRFDKAIDDRVPEAEWPKVLAPLDVVILEGWCLCVPCQQDPHLLEPVNALEKMEDVDGRWRQFVNAQLREEYHKLYGLVDFLIMLKAPSFDKVYEWRQTQEDKLAEAIAASGSTGTRLMDRRQLQRFIQHYERLTRHGLDVLPEFADVVFELTDSQTIAGKLKG